MQITNKATGKKYPVTQSDIDKIRANRMTRNLYTYPDPIETPAEVIDLQNQTAASGKAQSKVIEKNSTRTRTTVIPKTNSTRTRTVKEQGGDDSNNPS